MTGHNQPQRPGLLERMFEACTRNGRRTAVTIVFIVLIIRSGILERLINSVMAEFVIPLVVLAILLGMVRSLFRRGRGTPSH
jgi:hypothetical protein